MIQVVVVVVTRNRPEALGRLIGVLPSQIYPPVGVIIVDASDRDKRQAVEATLKDRRPLPILLRFMSRPSLTDQRNFGVELALENFSQAELILFLDDDVIPAPDYIERLVAIFHADADRNVGGASGVSQPRLGKAASIHYRLFTRFFFLDGGRAGSVRASGINVPVKPTDHRLIKTDWLFGCSAYRREVFKKHQFDGSREGYVLFEDVDFSARVGHDWLLMVDPLAKIWHEQLPDAGVDEEEWSYQFVLYRHALVARVLRPKLGTSAFWWSTVGYLCYWGAKSSLGDSSGALRVRGAWRGIRELLGRPV